MRWWLSLTMVVVLCLSTSVAASEVTLWSGVNKPTEYGMNATIDTLSLRVTGKRGVYIPLEPDTSLHGGITTFELAYGLGPNFLRLEAGARVTSESVYQEKGQSFTAYDEKQTVEPILALSSTLRLGPLALRYRAGYTSHIELEREVTAGLQHAIYGVEYGLCAGYRDIAGNRYSIMGMVIQL